MKLSKDFQSSMSGLGTGTGHGLMGLSCLCCCHFLIQLKKTPNPPCVGAELELLFASMWNPEQVIAWHLILLQIPREGEKKAVLSSLCCFLHSLPSQPFIFGTKSNHLKHLGSSCSVFSGVDNEIHQKWLSAELVCWDGDQLSWLSELTERVTGLGSLPAEGGLEAKLLVSGGDWAHQAGWGWRSCSVQQAFGGGGEQNPSQEQNTVVALGAAF